jgi:tetratricopeptide (TPR) repeat protein
LKGWAPALALYERCVAEDPHYAPAWAGAGRMHRMIGKYVGAETYERLAKSEQALKRALELNPDLTSAENTLAHLEVDLGRAEASMVRLLKRAKDRPADPELYAGLTQACRYCGLMSASIAATEQARRLDPRIRTSGALTYFALADYEKVLDFQAEHVPYMMSLALVMLGRRDEVRPLLGLADLTGTGRLGTYVQALLAIIDGRNDEAAGFLRSLVDIPDPEAHYYLARALAHVGVRDEPLALLSAAVANGFFCVPAFTRDPWLDSLRGTPEFSAMIHAAEARHRQAMISFLTAEGDRILGVSHPV